jgi:hypothetical protein
VPSLAALVQDDGVGLVTVWGFGTAEDLSARSCHDPRCARCCSVETRFLCRPIRLYSPAPTQLDGGTIPIIRRYVMMFP